MKEDFNFSLEPGKKLNIKNYQMDKPVVSVIIPFYYDKEYIEQSVNSILNQTYPYYEILIIDDGTKDEEHLKKLEEIERLDKRKTGATIEEIRNLFCNSQSSITTQKFRYLENWLRQQGKLKSRASEVVHLVIDPIINDNVCLKLLADNAIFYKELFDVAGNDALATKQKIEKIINSGNADEKILEFGKLIGITKENYDKQ